MGNCLAAARRSLTGVLAERGGNVTLLTAFAALPMFAIAGGVIDYVAISRDRTELQAAADSAAIAVAARLGAEPAAGDEALGQLASHYVQKNFTPGSNDAGSVDVDVRVSNRRVTLTARHATASTWLGALGVAPSRLSVVAEAVSSGKQVEMAIVMDTSRAMAGSKLDDARQAVAGMIAALYGGPVGARPADRGIRLGLVPFAGAVRLDIDGPDYSPSWIDSGGAASVSRINFEPSAAQPHPHNAWAWTALGAARWNGCVEARIGGLATDDTEPGDGDTLFTPYFAPDEPSVAQPGFRNSYIGNDDSPGEEAGLASTSRDAGNWPARQANPDKYRRAAVAPATSGGPAPWFNCAGAPLVGLTHDRETIEAAIQSLDVGGSTVIAEGLAWGWRALSPGEPLSRVAGGGGIAATGISPYGADNWRKAIVLVSGGGNDVLASGDRVNALNGSYYSAYGYVSAARHNRFGTSDWTAANAALDAGTASLCDNIKQAGIAIYAVAYTDEADARSLLRSCATSEAHYSDAGSGAELAAALERIAARESGVSVHLSR